MLFRFHPRISLFDEFKCSEFRLWNVDVKINSHYYFVFQIQSVKKYDSKNFYYVYCWFLLMAVVVICIQLFQPKPVFFIEDIAIKNGIYKMLCSHVLLFWIYISFSWQFCVSVCVFVLGYIFLVVSLVKLSTKQLTHSWPFYLLMFLWQILSIPFNFREYIRESRVYDGFSLVKNKTSSCIIRYLTFIFFSYRTKWDSFILFKLQIN